jgi:sortase A
VSAQDVAESPRSAHRPRRTLPFEVHLVSQILLMLCVGVLGFVGYLVVISPIQQNSDQDRLYAAFREQLAAATAPTGGMIDPGSPVALLTIPGLSLNQVVVQGTSSGDLQAGPGHLRNTALPGQAGGSAIYGKASTFGAPFRQVDRLQAGDRITATTGQGAFTYRVIDVRRTGDPLPPPLATGAGRLTLVTSEGPDLLRHGQTVFVDADLLDTPQPTPAGQPRLVPPEERAMASDTTTANMELVLWLQALGVVLAGIVWGRQRWGKGETLVVGVPIALAVVWNLYEAAGRLLPNVL